MTSSYDSKFAVKLKNFKSILRSRKGEPASSAPTDNVDIKSSQDMNIQDRLRDESSTHSNLKLSRHKTPGAMDMMKISKPRDIMKNYTLCRRLNGWRESGSLEKTREVFPPSFVLRNLSSIDQAS